MNVTNNYIDNEKFTQEVQKHNLYANPFKYHSMCYKISYEFCEDKNINVNDTIWSATVSNFFEIKRIKNKKSFKRRMYDKPLVKKKDLAKQYKASTYELNYFEQETYKLGFDKEYDIPTPNNYIGKSFMDISNGLVRTYKFNGYTKDWKNDMVGDSVEACLRYMHNFSSTKSSSAFSYFSMLASNMFIQRIKKEKKQLYIKGKAAQHMSVMVDTLDGENQGVIDNIKQYLNNVVFETSYLNDDKD